VAEILYQILIVLGVFLQVDGIQECGLIMPQSIIQKMAAA